MCLLLSSAVDLGGLSVSLSLYEVRERSLGLLRSSSREERRRGLAGLGLRLLAPAGRSRDDDESESDDLLLVLSS